MVPDSDPVIWLSTQRHRDLLQEADQRRLLALAESGARSRSTARRSWQPAAIAWLVAFLAPARSRLHAPVTPRRTSRSAQPA